MVPSYAVPFTFSHLQLVLKEFQSLVIFHVLTLSVQTATPRGPARGYKR
jgi:hypothetical protein